MFGWRQVAIGLALVAAAEPKATVPRQPGPDSPADESPPPLVGRFLLTEQAVGAEVPDAIEFRSDGKCFVDFDRWSAMVAVCTADRRGALHVYTGMPHQLKLDGTYRMGKYTLTVSQPGWTDLLYARAPAAPHPAETDVQGIFLAHSELGDAATEVGPNHTFRAHLINFLPDHTYYDIRLSGHYDYADGVIFYHVEHSAGAPGPEKYVRDVVLKREKHCLWIVDQFHDTAICQALVTTGDLPPPPSGYRPTQNPSATHY